MVLHISAIIVAFVASVAFLNSVVEFSASLVGFDGVTFEWILGNLKGVTF